MAKQMASIQFDNFSGMHSPFLLKGMDEALKRIVKAVNNREKIIVYGYYDLDGITSVSLLFLVLKYLNADVEYFISDDRSENNHKYDISSDTIKNHVKFLGSDLMITVGCGINSCDEIDLCSQLGIDVIITDWHTCKKDIPKTIVVNPKQEGCMYPFKELSGVGVTYKLVQAISSYYQMKCVSKYLDLTMLGTVSNDVPFVGENKIIIDEGLYYMNYTNNYGLRALMKIHKIKDINIESIYRLVYSVMPSASSTRSLINARIIVELFTTSNSDRAEQIAKYLKNEIKVTKFCI